MGPDMIQIPRRYLIQRVKLEQRHLRNGLVNQQWGIGWHIGLDIGTAVQVVQHTDNRSVYEVARRGISLSALALRVSGTACLLNDLCDILKEPDVESSSQPSLHEFGVLGQQMP